MALDDLPELLLPDVTGWQDWLGTNAATCDGVLLVLAGRSSPRPAGGAGTTLTYDEALDEALCAGWIDGQVRSRPGAGYVQRFGPRRARSIWSARNVGHVERLAAAGRMTPAGVAEVERARADGRWANAYAGQATAALPGDLLAAIGADPAAQATLELLTSQNRYAMGFRLGQLRREWTRTRRIAEYVAMLARGEALHPQRGLRPPPGPAGPDGDGGHR